MAHARLSRVMVRKVYTIRWYTYTIKLLHYTFCIRPSNNLIIYNGEQKTWHVINSYSLYLRLIG